MHERIGKLVDRLATLAKPSRHDRSGETDATTVAIPSRFGAEMAASDPAACHRS